MFILQYIQFFFQNIAVFALPIYFGYSTHLVMNNLGIKHGWKGVYFYDEAHLSMLNRVIHTSFMIGTSFGIMVLLPTLIGIPQDESWKFFTSVYLSYLTHYYFIDFKTTIVVAIHYLPSMFMAWDYYINHTQFDSTVTGLAYAVGSLLIQEYSGHYIGGDIPSRSEGVFNAIFYAIFSSSHTIIILFNEIMGKDSHQNYNLRIFDDQS